SGTAAKLSPYVPGFARPAAGGAPIRSQCGSTSAGTQAPDGSAHDGQGARQLAAELNEQRLERQPGRQVELLERTPCLTHELARALGAGEPLGRAVFGELRQAVVVHDRPLGSD